MDIFLFHPVNTLFQYNLSESMQADWGHCFKLVGAPGLRFVIKKHAGFLAFWSKISWVEKKYKSENRGVDVWGEKLNIEIDIKNKLQKQGTSGIRAK